MGTFRLEPIEPRLSTAVPAWEGLGNSLLLFHAWWFTRIRWVVVGALVALGCLATGAPQFLRGLGLVPPQGWPWALAGVLAAGNLVVFLLLRAIRAGTSRPLIVTSIWLQIVLDLCVLTLIVHLVGPIQTVLPFAYIFHITLACIFFTRRHSSAVLLLSVVLFLGVVGAEHCGIAPARGLLESAPRAVAVNAASLLTFALPTVFVWVVIWYLVATITRAIRQRDRELDEANRRLLRADEEKNRQVLHVTHDLKAPFSGIESNIQILRASHWHEIPDSVRLIIGKIEARGHTLRARIGDILTLGDLRSAAGAKASSAPVALQPLLADIAQEVQGLAERKNITVVVAPDAAEVRSDPRQLRVLFANLIANAVTYSHPGGEVNIAVRPGDPPRVRIADQGIGIAADALPHVFDDYFRTKEAAQFNAQSTGLGLAIVRQVALNLGLTVLVDSEPGRGTAFEISIPDRRESDEPRDG